jgi:hypothetical protein
MTLGARRAEDRGCAGYRATAPVRRAVGNDQHVHEHLDLLRREFEADPGTFLFGLRGDRIEWDRAAFSRFEKAMRWACEHFQDGQQLDRWMAEGFYYTSWFVRDWTAHPPLPTARTRAVLQRLHPAHR